MSSATLFWQSTQRAVERAAPGSFHALPKSIATHPREAGALPSIGLPRGQLRDWRFPPDSECRGLHVQEFEDRWEVHQDQVHPDCDPIEHVRRDAPVLWMLGGTALGALIGLALSEKKEGALVGAGLGLLLTALTAKRET